jgi:arylsulfatase A-like enzyme
MIGGALELAAFLLKCLYLDPRNFNVSHHFPWMYPLAGILVLAAPGALVALAARLRPGAVRATMVFRLLLFVTLLGLLFRCPIYTAVCLLLAAGLAVRVAPWLARRIRGFDRLVRWSLVVQTLLLLATIAACYGREPWARWNARIPREAAPRGARSVILIVLDTVRADGLSLYGDQRATTPNLARLATRGVRFDQAFATAPWTAPSHASMFTGRWSHELSVGWNRPLDGREATLAEFLGSKGYATAGFVANTTYCSYETGLDRGFAHYEDYDVSLRSVLLCSSIVGRTVNFIDKHPVILAALGPCGSAPGSSGNRKSAARINRDFLAWLERHQQREGDRPFFAFLNYYDAHHPYFPQEADPGFDDGRPLGRKPASAAEVQLLKKWWDIDKRRLDPGSIALARDSYDRCIASLDHELGRLFDTLERRGVLGESLVVVTADHGEHFGEHGLFGHGCSLYLPELHVPLLILPPEQSAHAHFAAGRIVAAPVSLRDLAATIVTALGPEVADRSPFFGHSLLDGSPAGPVLAGIEAPPEADPNHGASPVCRGPLVSVVEHGFQYIRGSDGGEELYDLENDPGEIHNLARTADRAETPEHFRRMRSQGGHAWAGRGRATTRR